MARIFIIDDDVDFVNIHKEILEKEGHSVETFYTSSDALSRLSNQPLPDAIIVDLMIEKDDAGIVFCHKVKSNSQTKHIPIIMLTSVNTIKNLNLDVKSNFAREWIKADKFLDKPVRKENLISLVNHVLSNQ